MCNFLQIAKVCLIFNLLLQGADSFMERLDELNEESYEDLDGTDKLKPARVQDDEKYQQQLAKLQAQFNETVRSLTFDYKEINVTIKMLKDVIGKTKKTREEEKTIKDGGGKNEEDLKQMEEKYSKLLKKYMESLRLKMVGILQSLIQEEEKNKGKQGKTKMMKSDLMEKVTRELKKLKGKEGNYSEDDLRETEAVLDLMVNAMKKAFFN